MKITWDDEIEGSPKNNEPSTLQTIGAAVTRPFVNLGEKLGGLPGDLLSNAQETLNPKFDESTSFGKGMTEFQKNVGPSIGSSALEKVSKYVPTSESLNGALFW